MRYKFLHLFIAVTVATGAFAQDAGRRASESAPSTERLRKHVAYLASDKLEGRRTGTAGAELAAQYIAAEFARLGLLPGGDVIKISQPARKSAAQAKTYRQTFPYVAGVEAGEGNAMVFASRMAAAVANAPVSKLDLRLGEDWMPMGWSANGRADNLPVTFVGYGIAAAELNHDDYAGVDVAGRIALALSGTPDADNPHGQFVRFTETRLKAAAARERGAKALVIIAGEENFKDDPLARLRYDNTGGDAGFPVVVISRQVARRIIDAAATPGSPLMELERKTGALRASEQQPTAMRSAHEARQPMQTPHQRNFSASLRNVALSITTEVVRRERPASNVVGILEGADPQLKREVIVIGAHYDHLGHGGQGSLAPREGEIHHGADDNASGTAGLLELARHFAQQQPRPRRTVAFIAFAGEEEGLLGSHFYVNNAALPLAQTVAMINMDMIGRLRDDRLMIGGTGTAQEWKKWIEQANAGASATTPHTTTATMGAHGEGAHGANAKEAGGFALALNEDGFGPSDHSSFYARQTPVLFFFTGTHDDYHKPTDTADRLNYEGEARILRLISRIIGAVDASDARPTYAVARSEGMGRTVGFRVYLGTVPNYADTTDGMKLDAVRDDSPASVAGLLAGDVIVKLAGREIRNVYDYTYALSEMKAAQEYEVEVVREGRRLQLKITPAARK